MEKQPAKVNYFFGDVYRECGHVISSTFSKWRDRISDYWYKFKDSFFDLKDDLADVFTFEEPCSGFFKGLYHGALFGWNLAILLLNFIFAPIICMIFSALYIIFMALIMAGIYLVFSLVSFTDWVYRKIKHLSNGCPTCQEKFDLPVYVCSCGAQHTKLVPSKYGIFHRICTGPHGYGCGRKLPTTFLNGRGKLKGMCPRCGHDLTDAGAHKEIWIPVIGGPSSGKTCLITMTIKTIEEMAELSSNIEFDYQANVVDGRDDLFQANLQAINQGYLPDKTDATAGEKRMKYYQFNLRKKGSNHSSFISLCDMPGEVFAPDDSELAQVGFLHSDAVMIVIDPLSIQDFREELMSEDPNFDPYAYSASDMPMDEFTSSLTQTLENMLSRINAKVFKTAAIVITKMDVPGLAELIGPDAVRAYALATRTDEVKATNALCEKFLMDHGESSFINRIHHNFQTYRFFTCTPLGHNADGTPFTPERVEDGLLWILSKTSPDIKF